jgi:hypothetical protein
MTSSTRVFWWSGVVGIGLATLLGRFGGLGWVPFVNDLVRRGGTVGLIATAVLGTTLWVLLTLVAGSRRLAGEHRLTRYVLADPAERGRLAETGAAPPLPADEDELFALPEFTDSRLHRRFAVFQDRHASGDRDLIGYLLAARSGVDAARDEIPYGPVRALVWALPALGFLGTAAEMSSSIGGVGTAVAHTSSYGDLRDFLAQNVIPPLANAFGITLLALACSVVCHVLLSIARAREQRLAVAADDWALSQLAVRVPPAPAGQVINLNGDLDRLSREVVAWRAVVAKATDRAGDPEGAAQALSRMTGLIADIGDQLDEITVRMDRELVIRPVSADRGMGR